MATMWKEARLAFRSLLKNPAFTAVAVITLGLGIGANTAIFSVVNGVLLRPLPYPYPDELVNVFQTDVKHGVTNNGVSYPNLLDWNAQTHRFNGIAGYRESTLNLTGKGEPLTVHGADVTSGLFSVLQVPALQGRTLEPVDERANIPVAVIGEDLWRDHFRSDPSLIGSIISLDQQSYTVVGIMPASFQFPYGSEERPSVWILANQDPAFKSAITRRGGHYLNAIGRLQAGVKLMGAQEELSLISDRLERAYAGDNSGWGVRVSSLRDDLVGDVRTGLLVLLGAVAMVLLIACANIISLLLARFTVRQKELAIRTALGASRGDLARQIFVESSLLSLIGGAFGLLMAFFTARFLMVFIAPALPRVHEINLDGSVLLFTILLSLLVAALSGAAQMMYSSNAKFLDSLKESVRGASAKGAVLRVRNLLVISEIAVAMMLLVGAGLLLRSFNNLENGDLGFNSDNLWTAGITLPRAQYSKPEQWSNFYNDLLARVQTLPDVRGVAATLALPLSRSAVNFDFAIEGRPQAPGVKYSADYSAVSPAFFKVMNIPVLRGRAFSESDTSTAPAATIVNESFVRRFFPNEDPIGKQITFGFLESKSRQIVGVVGNTKVHGMAEEAIPVMYAPYQQTPWWVMTLVVRASGRSSGIPDALRQQVLQLDHNLPIEKIERMSDVIGQSVAQPRFRTFLLSVFAGLALVLATVGVYGIISYSVTQRTQEIGIRLALGANRRQILGLIMRHAVQLVIAGFAVGVAGSFLVTRLLSSLLFAVKPVDPITFAGAATLLVLVSIVASYVPARRAMGFDPIIVLRNQ
jgi:putative ABC transport system permease protein